MIVAPPAFATALLAVALGGMAPDLEQIDVSGQWMITETRAGNRCTGRLALEKRGAKEQPSQSVLGMQRGSAAYSSPCVDPAQGTWTAQQGGRTGPRLAARLEYEKSTVFYSLGLDESNKGKLKGYGEIYAAPRSDPNNLRKVGLFEAVRQ